MTRNATSIAAALIGLNLVFGSAVLNAAEGEPGEPEQTLTAPVVYENLMLIVKTPDGVAAIDFLEPIEKGVSYRFRYLAKGAMMEATGSGKVFERYKKEGDMEVYDGGELDLEAGAIKLRWSRGSAESGWIYYVPEKMQVLIGNDQSFQSRMEGDRVIEQLDLRRFR